ncbi:hypothetical protein ACWDV4_10595 [Micromonospora sp. NPDC003197]
MRDEQQDNVMNRRRLLRRAGTVAAGVAGAGVAGSIVASPAQAADGDPLKIGDTNTGTNTTSLTAGNASQPTLRLTNPNPSGPGLSLGQTASDSLPVQNPTSPVGSVYADEWGDLYVVGQNNPAQPKYLTSIYSETWSTMTVPVDPIRWVVTLAGFAGGRDFISGATFDSAGRLLPKGSTTTPDMVIDFAPILAGGYAAVQANLTVDMGTATGWAALWGEGPFPANSSINFTANTPTANFTQTLLGSDMKLRVKVNKPVVIIFDIQGFVLSNPFRQFAGSAEGAVAARGANASVFKQFQKRTPGQ